MRKSLTKKQRQTAIGAELLALCQTVTADGSLSPEEVLEIRDWLIEHKDADLPAVQHLIEVVTRIVADRKVTIDERRELFIALETVLPPELRDVAKAARRTREDRRTEALRVQQALTRQKEKDEKSRNDRLSHYDFMVAGCRYDGRAAVIARYVRDGQTIFFRRDPRNAYSPNAVEVLSEHGYQIGYIPEEDAVEVAPLLDNGHPYSAEVKKILTGGRAPIPVVIADVYGTDCSLDGVVRPDATVRPAAPPNQSANSWPTMYIVAVITAAIVAAVFFFR